MRPANYDLPGYYENQILQHLKQKHQNIHQQIQNKKLILDWRKPQKLNNTKLTIPIRDLYGNIKAITKAKLTKPTIEDNDNYEEYNQLQLGRIQTKTLKTKELKS